MDIVDMRAAPEGVVVTLGGQTPLASWRQALAGWPACSIMGTQPVRDRPGRGPRPLLGAACDELAIRLSGSWAWQSRYRSRRHAVAADIGYPAARCARAGVLGGRAHGHRLSTTSQYLEALYGPGRRDHARPYPVCLDRLPRGEPRSCDLDALCDGTQTYVGAIMEHIEMAGIHSGDSACCTPPFSISDAISGAAAFHRAPPGAPFGRGGLLNIQFAIKRPGHLHHRGESARQPHRAVRLEGNRRFRLAQAAARIMAGESMADSRTCPSDTSVALTISASRRRSCPSAGSRARIPSSDLR